MTSMWASAWWLLAARRWAAGSGRTGVDLGGAEADGRLAVDGRPAEDGTPAAGGVEAGGP